VIRSRRRGAPYTQRRAVAAVLLALLLGGLAAGVGRVLDVVVGGGPADEVASAGTVPDGSSPPTTTAPTTTPATTAPLHPSDTTALALRETITGDISPKSVVASGHGLVSAQNMMYTHTVTFYEGDGTLAATVDDGVDLAALGVEGHPGTSQGAPVEAAYTADGRHAYVSNYAMYGEGFGPEGSDSCTPDSGVDDSFVYRIDTETFEIDQAIEVGAVPKYVAVTPDGSTVLVTNWCTWDLSIVDVATATEVARVPIGRYPRGIAVSPDSRTAYVGVMGGSDVVAVDLAARTTSVLATVGAGPRHLLLSPDGATLYVTSNKAGTVSAVATATGEVVGEVTTGSEPRSMAISPDGTALYVVEYEASEVHKLRAADLTTLAVAATDHHPIGIAYEPTTGSVWVACYGGSIMVFDDTAPTAP
jgi:YVTN family beta-propeller protein